MHGTTVGPYLVGIGLVMVVLGLLAWAGGLGWFGRLPGDIRIGSESARVYFPIVSMLVVSLVLSVVVNLVRRFF